MAKKRRFGALSCAWSRLPDRGGHRSRAGAFELETLARAPHRRRRLVSSSRPTETSSTSSSSSSTTSISCATTRTSLGCRADAAPPQLHPRQRHDDDERPHRADLAHGERDPHESQRDVLGPPRAAGVQLVPLLQVGRHDSLVVLVQVLDRPHRRRRQSRRRTRRRSWSTGTAAHRRTRQLRGCRTRVPAATGVRLRSGQRRAREHGHRARTAT